MTLDPWEAVLVVLAGIGGGGINAVIGSGSLITFPTLLAVGYSPVVANVSNNIGMVPGAVFGTYGFRRELKGQKHRARIMATASGLGGLTGAVVLLTLPSDVFDTIVPILVLLAVVLMLLQPRLSAWVAGRRADGARDVGAVPLGLGFLAGVYGGYFGAAQGVIVLAILAVFVPDDLTRSNALKNLLVGTVNAMAAVVFVFFADVAWEAVVLVAIGAAIGGTLGAQVGRRVPAPVLRGLVVVIGVIVAIRLFLD